jgi:glucose-6-phosphate isomerase
MLNLDLSGYMTFKRKEISLTERPFFHGLAPDFAEIRRMAKPIQKYRRIILVGNGGAVNSFIAIYRALYSGEKKVTVINSMEPDLINEAKRTHPKKETLIIVSSTSGTNVGVLEIMSQFLGYPMRVMTADNGAALQQLAVREKIPVIYVPHVVDRFQASSALAYLPLALLGIDIERIDRSIHAAYDEYATTPDAKDLAVALYQLEEKGYVDVFLPIYGSRLEGFSILITQLMHESVCKSGRGQTFLVVAAPECQHHTNQRFFGGQKNMCALFMRVLDQNALSRVEFAEAYNDVKLREGTIASINHNPLSKSFEYEFTGTYQDARQNKIPVGILQVGRIDEDHVARLIAFWSYVAVYSCHLRKVNPFDQPQVEKSKEISFQLRDKHL